jgi:hypothetical protein
MNSIYPKSLIDATLSLVNYMEMEISGNISFDGEGILGIGAKEIPMMSQIIKIASIATKHFAYSVNNLSIYDEKIHDCMIAVSRGGLGWISIPDL